MQGQCLWSDVLTFQSGCFPGYERANHAQSLLQMYILCSAPHVYILLDHSSRCRAGKTLGRDSALRILAAIARSPATDGVTLVGPTGLRAVLPLLTVRQQPSPW